MREAPADLGSEGVEVAQGCAGVRNQPVPGLDTDRMGCGLGVGRLVKAVQTAGLEGPTSSLPLNAELTLCQAIGKP